MSIELPIITESDHLARNRALEELNAEIDVCQRCAKRGYTAISRPIDRGRGRKRVWLIGQAPGLTEGERKMAFAGPAGRTLMKWFGSIGLSEEQVRDYFFLSAINKCYPGRANGGGGDRNPTPVERAICRPFLLRELALLRPKITILVGSSAIKEVYGDKVKLDEIIGRRGEMTLGELYQRLETRLVKAKEERHGLEESLQNWFNTEAPVEVYHLPHPSGASTWLNLPQNKALLAQALADLKERLATI
ncbi:MAG TPA: uracil-DNA glycosylase family protein [Chloroflexia bacterium]|nr:uracil-DNA glycosylase family protein [Chloroflexia bacterium]